MPEGVNEKPYFPIAFTLDVAGTSGARQQYETSNAACLFFHSGAGIMPGAISIQLDENEPLEVPLGFFMRVQRFDKFRVINNSAVAASGKFLISADPDFLAFVFPTGI